MRYEDESIYIISEGGEGMGRECHGIRVMTRGWRLERGGRASAREYRGVLFESTFEANVGRGVRTCRGEKIL